MITGRLDTKDLIDFEDVQGQYHIRRAIEIAVAGNHKLMVIGNSKEPINILENATNSLLYRLNGVLYENQNKSKIRHYYNITFVSIAACPCGCISINERQCVCTLEAKDHFKATYLPSDYRENSMGIEYDYLNMKSVYRSTRKEESTEAILERINKARVIQENRYTLDNFYNSNVVSKKPTYLTLDVWTKNLLNTAIEKLQLTEADVLSLLQVGRTITDLADKTPIEIQHMAEAIQYKQHIL